MVDDDGADKDFIWMDPDDGDGPPANDPVAGAEGEGDDATWVDDPQQKRTVLIAQIALVILVLIGVAVILAVKSNKDDNKGDKKTEQTADSGKDGGSGSDDGDSSGKPKGKPDWPKEIANRPPTLGKRGQKAADVKVTAKPGVYIWNDFDGWHMWVVAGAGVPPKMTGTITSSDNFARADAAVPGTGSAAKDGKLATFDLATDKPLSGVDFSPGFYANRLVFALNGPDGKPVDVALVHLGGGGKPATFPLVLDKTAQ